MAIYLFTRQDPSRPHPPAGKKDAVNWDQHAILLEGRKKTPPGVGWSFDSGLTDTSHVRKVAKNAAWKLELHPTRLRTSWTGSGSRHIYKSQVRSLMEYSPLAWSSYPPSYRCLLDRVQARAQRLARLKAPEDAAQIIQPLQQRRDVAGMWGHVQKGHRMQLLQLAELRLNPGPGPPIYPCGPQHRHQGLAIREDGKITSAPSYPAMVDYGTPFGAPDDLTFTPSMHAFKSGVNAWLQEADEALDGDEGWLLPITSHKASRPLHSEPFVPVAWMVD
ncbi:hypothetical protein GWK47_001249 [Chionoecetes opilio]|uniref:Uncharacterized protein n=1 Tax=Chionoecetes opilio TaxID=41210 RepID=A0A8J4XW43_CHIOP|nr:hypothetical protein GWK47_001249 [Chionoecetes opilio]